MQIDKKHWSVPMALDQIRKCDFECGGGPLANNVAWQWLEAAAKIGPEFWPGQGVWFVVEAAVSGIKLRKSVHFFIVGVSMSSDTERRLWHYSLSNDPPAPWHYGVVQHVGVSADKLSLTPHEVGDEASCAAEHGEPA